MHILTLWFIITPIVWLALRCVTHRFFGGNATVDNTDEMIDAYERPVKVTKTIGPGNITGRVDFEDTSWEAISDGSEIKSGEMALIIDRQNSIITVKPQPQPQK